jgi:hypothetical protein
MEQVKMIRIFYASVAAVALIGVMVTVGLLGQSYRLGEPKQETEEQQLIAAIARCNDVPEQMHIRDTFWLGMYVKECTKRVMQGGQP